ncbi:MAG: DNA methylase [Bacteroidales bacterium]|nr:DNA methylase [Bacteroidales bacterium]
MDSVYIAIDLKSFYASVECVDRGLDPMSTDLVVADLSRTDKTICLAVSPCLKARGVPGRPRLFEVERIVRRINAEARREGRSEVHYQIAPPRMARYLEVSGAVYSVYLKYIAPEDIHVYSVDEVFIDATRYLKLYSCSAHELTVRMIRDVLQTTGITATAGIGSNLYLAKVAMDIVAKHCEPDADGVRIAELDETLYRTLLWNHTPLRDFWRVGRGIAARLEQAGIRTMGELARRSLQPNWENFLYREFGVNAELLIDHAWGWEPCTMEAIKSYRPHTRSLSSGQVLKRPYSCSEAEVIVCEMIDSMALELVEKRLLTDQISLSLNYDAVNLKSGIYNGKVVSDHYGRGVPKPAHGSINLDAPTSSGTKMTKAVKTLFERIADKNLSVRRVTISVNRLQLEDKMEPRQLSLFDGAPEKNEKERRSQEAVLEIRKKFGKNAILKGINFEEGATAAERNSQIGGHKA